MSTTTSPTTTALSEPLQLTSSSSQHESSIASPSILESTLLQDVDNEAEKHPRGKRKRTAAKDKMILESAYRCNPKPDKQARQEIVERVSLNEKEVQIWFQNRRQNDRRKSRPLSQEELAALRFGGMHHITSDPVGSRSSMVNLAMDRPFPSSDPGAAASVERGPPSPKLTKMRPDFTRSYSDAAITVQKREPSSSQESDGVVEPMSQSFSGSIGYLANRWNTGTSLSTPSASTSDKVQDNSKLRTSHPSFCSSDKNHDAQSDPQSRLRLSLSLEGKAEVVSNQTSPVRPSPLAMPSSLPHLDPQRRQRGSLTRSHSAFPSITLPPISTLTNSLPPPRLVRGRSRDVHAWESCADSERRDELTTQAEHESNGSAIAAISLLRSSSSVLQPIPTKRNASLTVSQQTYQVKKARFSRSYSSSATLEHAAIVSESKAVRKNSDGKMKVSLLLSPTDSDKENWVPDENGIPDGGHLQQRRPLPGGPVMKGSNPRRPGRTLRDCGDVPKLSNRADTAPAKPVAGSRCNTRIDIFEDGSPAKKKSREDEVERFMRGEISPSKKPDMDCVAGLLSLSQGAWR